MAYVIVDISFDIEAFYLSSTHTSVILHVTSHECIVFDLITNLGLGSGHGTLVMVG